jgi:hypothetical protein
MLQVLIPNHRKILTLASLAVNAGKPRVVAALTTAAQGGIGLGQIRTFWNMIETARDYNTPPRNFGHHSL